MKESSACNFQLCLGGNDKNAVVFNKDTEQVVAILQGHGKKVTGVIYHPDEVYFCAYASACRVIEIKSKSIY